MSQSVIEADYLVLGAGAMGMAFTDTLLTETEARIAIVDRHHQPGGHWNQAYPFVRLHQPSSFYGVNSRPLGNNTIDYTGWNKGLYELATSGEICAYFDQVMQQQFLPSGRVQYFPMCEYLGDQRFVSRVSNYESAVKAKKIVDATYMNVRVPAMGSPAYSVGESVTCVPLNALPAMAGPAWQRYTVIGAGKTGIDACLFLLKSGIDPGRITWVMPRDSWIQDRANVQLGDGFLHVVADSMRDIFRAIVAAESVDDLFARLNAYGQLLRIDERMKPTMWRCSTVTQVELLQLRRIENVIRMGRVQSIERDTIVLDSGRVATNLSTLYVDCSADGLARRPAKSVFDGPQICLQSVRTCQQVFSAAFIGHIEAHYNDERLKNELCSPVPHPDSVRDYITGILIDIVNAGRWAAIPDLQGWLESVRLDWMNKSVPSEPMAEDMATLMPRVVAKLQKMLASMA